MITVKNKTTGQQLDLTGVWESNVPGQVELISGRMRAIDEGILNRHSTMFVNGEDWLMATIGDEWLLQSDRNHPIAINECCVNCFHEDCADCGTKYKIHEMY